MVAMDAIDGVSSATSLDTMNRASKDVHATLRNPRAFFGRPLRIDRESVQPGGRYRLYTLDITDPGVIGTEHEHSVLVFFLLDGKHRIRELRIAFFE